MRYSNQVDGCQIWPSYAATGFRDSSRDVIAIEYSPRVGGRYEITYEAISLLGYDDTSDKERAILTSILVDQREQGIEWPMVTTELVRKAKTRSPIPVDKRAERLLRYIAECSSQNTGGWVSLLDRTESIYLGALAWSESTGWQEIAFLCEDLSKRGLIELPRFADGSLAFNMRLTVDGYSRVAEANTVTVERHMSDPEAKIIDKVLPKSNEDTRVVRNKKYDFFICHASEDKKSFVRPMAEALIAQGANVWYDEFTLKVGDSLRREIDRGLADSSFGIVVLSPNFFEKEWPKIELDGLVTLKVQEQNAVLPIWHGVSKDDVTKFSPTLADIYALNTFSRDIDEIVTKLVEALI